MDKALGRFGNGTGPKAAGDAPRPGAPDRITAEQWFHIMALAYEPPESLGLPITNWSHNELGAALFLRCLVVYIIAGTASSLGAQI
ncbi:MAG: hypothetical protein D3909_10760 [Candidatus Electrothrix sp. ATG1]|nr:hypothetical protein [Candidatus Electrothrix sp. ATG1]